MGTLQTHDASNTTAPRPPARLTSEAGICQLVNGGGSALQYYRQRERVVMADQTRIILFPGMGADHRLFNPQRSAGLEFDVPAFPMPLKGESFRGYARRVGEQTGAGPQTVVGGVSFGGMLAYQVAVECGAKAVLMISSCTTGRALPSHYRVAERIARVLPDRFLQKRVIVGARLLARLEGLDAANTELVQVMARDASIPFLRRAGLMVLRWDGAGKADCPLFALHGSADRVIPVGKTRPTNVITGAGHLLCLNHADRLTEFIENALYALSARPSAAIEAASLAG